MSEIGIKHATPTHVRYLRKSKQQLRDMLFARIESLGKKPDMQKYFHWDKYSLAVEFDNIERECGSQDSAT